MSASTTALDQEFAETIDSLFQDADSILIVNPEPDVFKTTVLTAVSFDGKPPDIQVLASADVLKASLEDFILASQVTVFFAE
ncbi:hypothetical protein [Haladaptatus sp. DYF46]|uniref:transcriptional regulator TbsP domain-containing protein n=1 Tax=Haladaptatus sp. DYF46 TaxID=2886041 RepID=UPI001E36BABC|nr:hypothetical protein [Haladaptatus sp. DYF46]